MKKFVLSIMMVLCIFFSACSSHGESFKATIIENNEDTLLIEPLENEEELKSSKRILVSKSQLDSDVSQLDVEDIIEITYNGVVLESYPAQLDKIFSIKLAD